MWNTPQVGNYFSAGCGPRPEDLTEQAITKVEETLSSEFERMSFGFPMRRAKDASVREIMSELMNTQALFIEGSRDAAIDKVVNELLDEVKEFNTKSAAVN